MPGISLQAGEGGGASSTTGDMFNLRGFSANNSLFVDGVRDDGLIARDVFNLEQVEVFLGPTGTDVGRGTAAGYVNMTTKTPAVQSRYAGMVTVGTADQRRVSVDLNQAMPLGEPGHVARRDRGPPERAGPGQRRAGARRSPAPHAGAWRRRWRSGSARHTRLAAGGQFTHQDNVPDYGIPGAAWPEDPLTPTPQATTAGRSVELLRHARLRLRPRVAGQHLRPRRARPAADRAAQVRRSATTRRTAPR